MTKRRAVLAIDIGGTNISAACIDRSGKILAHSKFVTAEFSEPSELAAAIAGWRMTRLQVIEKEYQLAGAGIGAPNGNFFRGTIEYAPNLRWKGIVPLVKLFHEALDLPCVLTNDANAAALGELYFGDARSMKDFIFITLGTGLGSGLVVNGELVYGHDGFAGELGHTLIIPHGRPCGCGRRGCLEQYCSAGGLVKTYLEILRTEDPEINVQGSGDLDARYIYEKALGGDEAAFYAFNYTGELLGYALANAVAFTGPEAIFLFGGLAEAGELLFNPTLLSFEKNLLNIYRDKVRILPSGLPGKEAALLGAASLIWNELEKSSP